MKDKTALNKTKMRFYEYIEPKNPFLSKYMIVQDKNKNEFETKFSSHIYIVSSVFSPLLDF